MPDIFTDYTLRVVALGAMALGAVSGALGAFAVLRRQALLGDAISHAALPGIVLAFMLTGTKATLPLLVGAALAGWLGTLFVLTIVRQTRVPEDSALGIVLSVFFGTGLLLLTHVQHMEDASQAGLTTFLFGQAATLLERDVIAITVAGGIAILLLLAGWKEFKLLSFDPIFAASLGYHVRLLDIALVSLLVIAIAIGLQTVGVVLMSALVVAPGAAARQWTNSLGAMVLLSAVFGALSGLVGAIVSAVTPGIPTGPSIVLVATGVVVVSIALAPGRGLVWQAARHARNRRQLRTETVLTDLYALGIQHAGQLHGHDARSIEALGPTRGAVGTALQQLAARGLAEQLPAGGWTLTDGGRAAAKSVLRHRRHTDPDGLDPVTGGD
ncbi:MAG TPA: iron chelate uptake ABC transporter family permease subunit [Gemmatimonadales bacterium]|nr:iron chelate uptake ABC transporter family permease subunit [Gemmatimonadales bacterium]